MQKGILWHGKYLNIPGSYSRVDPSGLAQTPLGGINTVVVLFTGAGLFAPKTMQSISDASLARELLEPTFSEEARLAADLVFDPSPDYPGASQVFFVMVNPATPAAVTFSNALVLTSYLFGLPANQNMAKIEAGTVSGKKISVQFGANPPEVFDNMSKSSFSIQYTGAGSAAVMSITPTAGAHSLATTCTGAADDNLALDLNAYSTIQALVAAINATGKYTAVVTTANPNDSSMSLDGVSALDIKTGVYTAHSDFQAIVDGINNLSGLCNASLVADTSVMPANVGWTYLAGGSQGTTTNDDWQAAYDLLKTTDINFPVPLTSDPTIHAMQSAHLAYMSGPEGKKERRGFVGGALRSWVAEASRTTAKAALITAAANLNDARTVYAPLGTIQRDPNGNPKLYPAYITAAAYAGLAGGGSPVEALTSKHVRCLGLETKLRPDERKAFIDGGLAALVADDDTGVGYYVDRSVTTWGLDANLYNIEFSVGNGADNTAAKVRKRHAVLRGRPGTGTEDATIINLTNGILHEELEAGNIKSYDPKATVLRVVGDARFVDYSAKPILPLNFIMSIYHLLPDVQTIQL